MLKMFSMNNLPKLTMSKWQLAVFGIGATGLLGIGYWYLKKRQTKTPLIDKELSCKEKILTPLEQSQQLKNEGNNLFRDGKYQEAILLYNAAIELCPIEYKKDMAIFYQNRAAAHENLKEWRSVIADCSKALELDSKYEKAANRKIKAERAVEQWQRYVDDITSAFLLQRMSQQNAICIADKVIKTLCQEAKTVVRSAATTPPSGNDIIAYFKCFTEDPVYEKLLEIDDSSDENGEPKGFLKAKTAFSCAQYDKVIPACTEEIESEDSEKLYLMEALSLRASFSFLYGYIDQALKDLTSIINTEDVDVRIKVNSLIKRAIINLQHNKSTECFNDFDLAEKLGPNMSDVYHHRGQLKLFIERPSEALVDLQRAIQLNSNFYENAAHKNSASNVATENSP